MESREKGFNGRRKYKLWLLINLKREILRYYVLSIQQHFPHILLAFTIRVSTLRGDHQWLINAYIHIFSMISVCFNYTVKH